MPQIHRFNDMKYSEKKYPLQKELFNNLWICGRFNASWV